MRPYPSFSVVIPTYQRANLVCDAVGAMRGLEYPGSVEIIIVVDGSTDGTAEMLEQVQCRFPLQVIVQENHGQANARNRGAAEAKGDVILFLDDDMMAAPDILVQHARSYAQGADAVVGDFPVDPRSAPGFLTESIAAAQRWERGSEVIHSAFDVFVGHLSVRRSAFEKLGGFDENFTAGGGYGNEDIDFGQRLLKQFEVRRNSRAIAQQRHVVAPREHMRRASQCAKADFYFAAKHPELADELYERRGRGQISRMLWMLAATPVLPKLLGSMVVGLSHVALRLPLRSNRKLAHLFTATYLVRYWSAMRTLERQSFAAERQTSLSGDVIERSRS